VRSYNFHQSCWRYKKGSIGKEENHPCFFCGHPLSLHLIDKMECKTCGIIKCPSCENCLCSIPNLQYKTLCRLHEKYCCNLPNFKGIIELGGPVSLVIVNNFVKTIQVCYDTEKKNGNIQ